MPFSQAFSKGNPFMKVVYLSQEVDSNQPFFAYLHGKTELFTCAPQPDKIKHMLDSKKIEAVIGLESQLNMIKSIIQQFPMINYALISSLTADDFHEATEGYGFFMQLPPAPQQEDAECFVKLLKTITAGAKVHAGRRLVS
jgi:hypothetical protein